MPNIMPELHQTSISYEDNAGGVMAHALPDIVTVDPLAANDVELAAAATTTAFVL